jgi:hypothetical protein
LHPFIITTTHHLFFQKGKKGGFVFTLLSQFLNPNEKYIIEIGTFFTMELAPNNIKIQKSSQAANRKNESLQYYSNTMLFIKLYCLSCFLFLKVIKSIIGFSIN